jgi:hypothetical protein
MDPDLLVRADSVVVAAHRGDVQVIDQLADAAILPTTLPARTRNGR